MIHHHATNRLAAHHALRSLALIMHAHRVSSEIDALHKAEWQAFLDGLREGALHYHANRKHVNEATSRYILGIWQLLRTKIDEVIHRQHGLAVNALLDHLPKSHLRHAMSAVPVLESVVPKHQERETVKQALFHPPTKAHAQSILDYLLNSRDWSLIGDDGQYKINAHQAASIVASGLSRGQSTEQMAKQIKPLYDGSKARARRVVRNYAAYVNTERTFAAAEALGPDVVLGYAVFDLLGPTARPDHVARHGTEYYRNPQPGQYDFGLMPHPPVDRGGPNEDEVGLRHNCRCVISPIISDLENVNARPFTDRADRLIPDPATFQEFWQTASEAEKREAAGARRLKLARDLLQREPGWEDLIDPETGAPMPLDTMRKLTPYQWGQRALRVRRMIDANRRAFSLIGLNR